MIEKKKKIQKQKGGLELFKIPDRIIEYFNRVFILLKRYTDLFELYKKISNSRQNYSYQQRILNQSILNQLSGLKEELLSYTDKNEQNHLLKSLCLKLPTIFDKNINEDNNMIKIKKSINIILQTLFSDISDDGSITFIMKLIKIYIHILFIQYLYSLKPEHENIKIFKNTLETLNKKNIIDRLKRHNRSFNSQTEIYNLTRRIRKIILEEYTINHGIPVFYGNKKPTSMGYNQFICEKVGVSSSKKRKYIINPVGAIAWRFIDKYTNVIDTPLYRLLAKILRFNYDRTRGNKISYEYVGIPKLTHLSNITIFCIAKNERLEEEIIHGDLSKCRIIFGCSLKMTAILREENIAPNEDILELLHILLNMYLENESKFLETEHFIEYTADNTRFPNRIYKYRNFQKI